MLLHTISESGIWLAHMSFLPHALSSFDLGSIPDHLFLAQNIPQTDLWGDLQRAFDNFVKTGQAWAFVIGLILGYMIKAFTTFG